MGYPDFWGAIIGIGSILTLYLLFKHADSLSNGNVGGEEPMSKQTKQAQKVMKQGDADDRVRVIFWDPWEKHFIGVTPKYLLVNGPPFNAKAQQYLTYNSTHIMQS